MIQTLEDGGRICLAESGAMSAPGLVYDKNWDFCRASGLRMAWPCPEMDDDTAGRCMQRITKTCLDEMPEDCQDYDNSPYFLEITPENVKWWRKGQEEIYRIWAASLSPVPGIYEKMEAECVLARERAEGFGLKYGTEYLMEYYPAVKYLRDECRRLLEDRKIAWNFCHPDMKERIRSDLEELRQGDYLAILKRLYFQAFVLALKRNALLDAGLARPDRSDECSFLIHKATFFRVFQKKFRKDERWRKYFEEANMKAIYREDGSRVEGFLNSEACEYRDFLSLAEKRLARIRDGRVKPLESGVVQWKWLGIPETETIESLLKVLLSKYNMETHPLCWRLGIRDGKTTVSYLLLRAGESGKVPMGMELETTGSGQVCANWQKCLEAAVIEMGEKFS